MASVNRVFRYDLTIHQGMDEYFPMRIRDSNSLVPDLSGWTATATFYPAPATLDSLHDAPPLGLDAGVMLGLFDGGEFGDYNVLLSVLKHATSAPGMRPWGRGIYNLDLISPYGSVQYRIRGTAELEEGTRHV